MAQLRFEPISSWLLRPILPSWENKWINVISWCKIPDRYGFLINKILLCLPCLAFPRQDKSYALPGFPPLPVLVYNHPSTEVLVAWEATSEALPFGTLEPLLWSALQASGCCPSARWLCLCLSPLHPPPSLVPCVTVDPQCFVSRSSRSITEFPQRTRFKHSGSQSSPVLL